MAFSPRVDRRLDWGQVAASGEPAAIAIPNLLHSKMAANEASAVGSLRALNIAAVTYSTKYGHVPATLATFGPPAVGAPTENVAGLIDSVLAADDGVERLIAGVQRGGGRGSGSAGGCWFGFG